MITKFNKEEQRITKSDVSPSSPLLATPFVVEVLPVQEAQASTTPLELAATPLLNRAMVERAIVTFFDNGETAKQRYKIAIRINLKNEDIKTSPEFIAPLTKDGRSFRRYTAPGTKDDLIDFHNEMRQYVKQQGIDNKPYFGKFHLNQNNWNNGMSKIQVEPHSYASVWYDGEGWSGVIKIYDFILPFDLFNSNITERQTKMGVKSTYLWQNPRYEKKQRPLTWAEKRLKK